MWWSLLVLYTNYQIPYLCMNFADTFKIQKNIDRTLFERGNVLKLSSYGPNNKKKSWNLWWQGGAASFTFKGLLEISPRTTCVKWYDSFSVLFGISFGVRQGSVLSPFLFAIYIDDVAKLCHMTPGVFIILHADDIMLLAPTVCEHNSTVYRAHRAVIYAIAQLSCSK